MNVPKSHLIKSVSLKAINDVTFRPSSHPHHSHPWWAFKSHTAEMEFISIYLGRVWQQDTTFIMWILLCSLMPTSRCQRCDLTRPIFAKTILHNNGPSCVLREMRTLVFSFQQPAGYCLLEHGINYCLHAAVDLFSFRNVCPSFSFVCLTISQ